MEQYTLQLNKNDTVTVFDKHDDWVGVFRTESMAYKFIKLVLGGELKE